MFTKRVFVILTSLFLNASVFGSEIPVLYDSVKYFYKNKDFKNAIDIGTKALDLAKIEDNKFYLAKTYYLLAFICEQNDDFGNAIIYYLEGARFAELSSNPDSKKDLISIYKNLSLILGDYRHYDLAYKFISEALRVAENQQNITQTISLLNNRIHELIDEERYEDGLKEIEFLTSNYQLSPERLISIQNKLGVVYHNLHNEKKAIENYLLVIDSDPTLNPEIYSMSLLNLGNIYLDLGNPEKAIDYYNQTISFSNEQKLNVREIRGYQKMGEAYFSLNEPEKAIWYFEQGIELTASGQETPNTYEIYKQTSNCYKALGQFETALNYERIYSVKLEEYIDQQKKIEELDKKYNIQLLTERYFDLLAADQEKKETEKLAKYGIGGTTFVFLGILFMMLYKQQRTKALITQELQKIELTSEV
ncbi:MAG: tetratricopeptide repeat protein [Marinoscillum sp.]